MGNKILRPNEIDPLSGFNDDQISYLKDKFQLLCDQQKLLSVDRIADAYKCSPQQARKILNYIDFQNQGQVDCYQFTCAAASLHQNDQDTFQFLYDLFRGDGQIDQQSFKALYSTVFRYLKYMNKIQDDQNDPEIGSKKFKQYDFNNNSTIGSDQFKSMLKNDYHCKMWMSQLGFSQQLKQQKPPRAQNEQNGDFLIEQASGDQAGSTPSWIKTIQYMAPNNKQPPAGVENPPNSNLDIQYVYGYRCYDTQDNLRYNSNGQVVYHTAGCGIVLNKTKNTMKVMTNHNNDITCLDYCHNKNLVVTGEMGRRPSVIVWDSNNLQVKNVFSTKLQKSIATVAISKSGKYVAATSMSDNHQIAIYDLSKGQSASLVAFGSGPRSVIHASKFTNKEDQLVLACQKQVVFVNFASGKIQNKKGIFGKAPLVANYCIALVGDSVVTGMGNGVLGYWKGNQCSRVYKEHVKPVTSICQRQGGGIISGDIIGTIILWTQNISKQRQILLPSLLKSPSNNPKIISLYQNNGNILVGTRGGQIIEISQKNATANVVMQGHFDHQLWGLSVMPGKRQFITGGQDKLLIKWDADKRKIAMKKKLQYSIISVDISCKNVVAVGHTCGVINFYDADKFSYIRKIQTFKNPDKQVISIVKFSPTGNVLAVGYCPPSSQVYLYDVQKGTKLGQSKGSPSRIVSIDFTRDGNSIMVNNTSYQILFFNSANGSQITTATTFRNQQFATMTSRFSWYTQGIWPPCSDGSDINSLDRSNSKKYLVTADDFSKVKLFKYPVCTKKQIYNAYKGHSSHVTGIKWTYDDKFVISTGGLQKSVIQWTFEDQQDINYQYQQKDEKVEQPKKQQEQYQFDEGGQQDKQEQQGQFKMEEDQGDQALAVKPFLGQVKCSTPLSFKTLSMKNTEPTQQLQIKHVWGIKNQYIKDRVRDQLRYSANYNSCIFITAALGVQMDLASKNQKYYRGHAQDLVSFAMSKDRKYCATGQMAQVNSQQPKAKIIDIHIWDADTKQRKAKLSGFHQRAVVILQFSPSGKKLLTIGQDDKNSLAIYDWEVGRLAWSSPVCGAKVTGAAWKNQQQFMTVGFKHVKLWNNNKGMMCKLPGKWDPMVSVVNWNDKFVSGGSQGGVYLWNGTSGVFSKGHEGRVDCLRVDDKGVLYSGCSQGIVNKWKLQGGKLTIDQKILDMSKFDSFDPGVLSLDFSPNNYLVCTNSSSIYQIPKNEAAQAKIIMQSHYLDQLWAESWSPDSKRIVTGGDDKTVRIYDTKTFQMLHSYKMTQRVRGLDWQKSKGQLIVVGDNKGKIYLFNDKLELLHESKTRLSKTKPRKQPFWIEDIKFSPDGKYVAFGAHGGATYIEIFEIDGEKFGKQTTIQNLISSATLSVDWSQDSSNLAVVSQAYQLQFTNLTSKVSASSMRDVKWATWTGKFGAYVQQIHQDINYSKTNAVDRSPTGQLIATGSDDQKIRLFKCPVIIPRQKNKQFIGHSSHITKVRFSRNQQFLLSVGGNDRTIILWKVNGGSGGQDQNQQVVEKKEQDQQDQEEVEGNEDADQIVVPKFKQQAPKQQPKAKDQDQFGLQQQEGDQFMAVKPWLGAIKQPTGTYYKGSGNQPHVKLELQYAHGYRCKDCRNNLIYMQQSKIAYHTAGLGIVMDISKNPKEQTFFNQHTDDIIAMAWKQDKSAIFTGQMGAKPVVCQWGVDGALIQKYKGAKKGVSAIGVSSKYVVVAGMDDDHHLNVFSLKSQKPICTQKGGKEFITGIKWVDEQTFVTIGIKHYKVWTLSGEGTKSVSIKDKKGSFGKNCNILCGIVVKQGKIYIGASDGSLQLWSGPSCSKSIKVHQKSLNSLCIYKQVLLTGSKDGTIAIMSLQDLKELARIDCKKLLKGSLCPQIQAIDVYENRIIVGTRGSQIFEIKSNRAIDTTDQSSEFRLIGQHMSGHYAPNHVTNQVWGLGVKNNQEYLTCADDGTLRIWDVVKRDQIDSISLDFDQKFKPRVKKPNQKFLPANCKGNSITISGTGQIIVGCKDGSIRVFDSKYRPRMLQKVTDKQISVVKLSPDDSILAVGDHIGKIVLLEWNPGATKLKVKSDKIKHHSCIKALDFSRDSNIIHSICSSYELLFWDVNTGKQITAGATSTRDEDWATWTLTLGWPVQGIFEPFMDGTDINAVDRSKKTFGDKGMRLVASSDDKGQVRLLEYPCLVKNSKAVIGRGHSSHVTNISFSKDDQRIFSTGGEDQTVLQWKVEQ